ncbi:hypothetical protein [Cytobacillus purgationiresistens]|uniref:Archaellum component FlaG (FlaF/FlaG flagellin family) n=1 Tax=Cytobacillus purgationiresistens TaxID=863449 RepID=A0ABU0ASL7_9BACI|nr:hypothetical protein [Cytobacillus purgationiresistens]MDQ0273787.1 archaellum component FlaG (FlaF/FlaG flagellin family) [Cytobacillus purgationiresistens]
MKNKFLCTFLITVSLIPVFSYSQFNKGQEMKLHNTGLAHEIFPEDSIISPPLHLQEEIGSLLIKEFINSDTSLGSHLKHFYANGHEIFPDGDKQSLKSDYKV